MGNPHLIYRTHSTKLVQRDNCSFSRLRITLRPKLPSIASRTAMLEPPGFTIDKPAEPARTIEFVRVSIQLLMTTSLVYRAMRYHPASSGCVTEEYPCSISPGSSTRSTHVHGDDEFFGSVKTAEDLGSDLESFDKAGQTSIHLLFV